MAHKSVIIVQKPGERIKPAYINILCKDFPSYMGVAAIEGSDLVATFVRGAPKAEQFEEISAALGEKHIVFTVGKAGHDLLDEDIQPFPVLRDKDGKIIASCFLAGSFEGYAVVKSTHTDEYHCVQDFIIPKLQKIYKSVGGGIPELIEELKDPVTMKDFNNAWTNSGNITLMTAHGPVTFTSKANIKQAEFNWGWTSDAFNYKEQTVAKEEVKAEVVTEAPMTLRQKLLAKAGVKKVVGETVVADVKIDVIGPVKPTLTSAAAINAVMEEYEDVRLPADANSWVNKKKIEWWVGEIGYKPEGYKDMKTTAKRRKGTKMGVLHPLFSQEAKDAAVATGQATPLPVQNNAPVASVEASGPIVDEVHVKDTSVKNVTTAYMPIISPKQKAGLRTSWMKDAEVVKVLGDDFKATIDPKELKGFEETYPTFWDGFGIDGSRPLSYEAYVKLGECDPRALAKLAWDNQNDALRLQLRVTSIIANPNQKLAM